MDGAPFAVFNVLFLTRRLASTRGTTAGAAFLARWLPSLVRALARVPSGSGASALPYNDPASPMVGYGFEDSVAKTGALNYASLLTLEACALLCQATRDYAQHHVQVAAHIKDADALCTRAVSISAQLAPALWDEQVGMFRPSTGLESNLTDVWGSAYAASLDGNHTMLGAGSGAWPLEVPSPTTPQQRRRIVAYLADPANAGLFAAGQVRHLPPGQSWVRVAPCATRVACPSLPLGTAAIRGSTCGTCRIWNFNPTLMFTCAVQSA